MSENEKPRRSVAVDPGRMRLAEYDRQEWVANAPEGCTIDDIKEPAFWSLMAAQMKPYDRVEVRADDGSWVADVIVLGCDRTWARVHILSEHKLANSDVALTQAALHFLKFMGPQRKWSVIRDSDKAIVKEGCGTKEEASTWMREHERVTSAI